MCQSLEDCLVSRIGFRVFLAVIGSILVAVLTLNIHYVVFRQTTQQNDDVAKSFHNVAGLDGAVSSAVVTGHTDQVVSADVHLLSHNRTKILIWTDDDGIFFAQLSRQIIYLRSSKGGCPSLNACAFSNDKKKLVRADAVLVAAKNATSLAQLPISGGEDIRSKFWSLLLQDPSYHSAFLEASGDVKRFDSVVSYLPNSTFPLVEIKFESKTKEAFFSPGPTKSTLLGLSSSEKRQVRSHKQQHHRNRKDIPEKQNSKTKRETAKNDVTVRRRLVATIIDECDTPGNREDYIDAMKKSDLEVQIYGKCGAPCPGHSRADCLKHIDNHYKFYLAFDSHICQHYLSPDLWQLLGVTTKLVPVVFGGVNYVEVLPHDAYIDALNQSPSSLAQTLLYLSKNEQDFQAYLSWRNRYSLQVREWPCYLCEALTEKKVKNKFRKKEERSSSNQVQLASEGLCTSWPHLNFAESQVEEEEN